MTGTPDSSPAPGGLRVLEVETFGRGGLAHYVANLSESLAERGHQVTIVTTSSYELDGASTSPTRSGGGDKTMRKPRILRPIATWSPRTAGRLPEFPQSLVRKVEAILDTVRVARVVRRERPDVVHFHCTNPVALLYLLLLRLARRPVVATAHVVTPHEPMALEKWVFGTANRLPDALIAHSEHDRERLVSEQSVDRETIEVVPHGDYGFFAQAGVTDEDDSGRDSARKGFGLDDGQAVALFFGYLREYKGLDVLLDAWPSVTVSRPEARLLIAGDPVKLSASQRHDLAQRAQQQSAVFRFEYIPLDEVSSYFMAADVLVLPYRKISQSGVLYLALALGVPVVASAIGPWKELLDDGVNALLVPPEDPEALAETLARVLGDAELREALAAGGRALAAEHSWAAIAERTEAIFEKLSAR